MNWVDEEGEQGGAKVLGQRFDLGKTHFLFVTELYDIPIQETKRRSCPPKRSGVSTWGLFIEAHADQSFFATLDLLKDG